MGFFDGWRALQRYNDTTGFTGTELAVSVPAWSDSSHLATVLLGDPVDPTAGPVSVTDALAVPPVARALALYSSVAATFPLVTEAANPPAWLTTTSGPLTPGHRTASTLQDLIFQGKSLWSMERTDAGEGYVHVPFDLWKVNEAGDVCDTDGKVQEDVIYFPSLLPAGFLSFGRASVHHYHGIMRAILDRSNNPTPITELKITDQGGITPEELKAAQDSYAQARRAKNGAITFTPAGIDLHLHDVPADAAAMLTEARNAVRLDMANFLNINAAMLDGNSGTSDNYSNTLQNSNEFLTLSLSTWLTPIEDRLSQADVIGAPVRFDTARFDAYANTSAAGNTGTAVSTPIEGTRT